ncbi:hypothetical protein [Rothia nasimurium]|uniref:hypothetical protein n=1 Tax=Rothia nasimurium TaxID=85336 RepID=UPI001F2FF146|nr:hypothetical protein [Rothia nasimurium]
MSADVNRLSVNGQPATSRRERKIAQKTALTSLAALMAAAPIVATPAAHAAEIPFEVTSVTLASDPDVNGNGVLNTTEVANIQVTFRIPGSAQGGDVLVANISDGYQPGFQGSIPIPSASDPNVIIGNATSVNNNQFIITLTDAVNDMVPGSISGMVGLSVTGDLNDDIEFDGPTAYPLAVNGVDSGHSYVIPGRVQPEHNQAPIYSFNNNGTDSLGSVGTLGYLANSGAGTYFFEFTPSDTNMWEYATSGNILRNVKTDNDVNVASNPDNPNQKDWEWTITNQAQVVVQEAGRVVVRVDNVPADTAVRVQLTDGSGVVLQKSNELYTHNVKIVKADSLDAANTAFETARAVTDQTQLKSATGAATGENFTYTANLVASVKAADGSFQDADTVASSVEVDKNATEVGRDFQLRSQNTGTGALKNPSIYLNGELVETVTTTVAAGDTFAYDTTKIVPIGAQTQNWEIRYENGPTVTNPTKTDTTFKLVPAIGLKALIGDADANTEASAAIYTVDSLDARATIPVNIQIPNPGDVPIVNPVITSNTGYKKVLEGVTIQPGETYTTKLVEMKRGVGVHSLEITVTDEANGTSATDPVVAIVHADVVPENPPVSEALPKGVVLADDTIRVRVGDTITTDLLANDPGAADGTALDPATGKVTASEGWTANEDGTFTHDSGLVVKYNGEGGLEIVKAPVEGKFGGLQYTAVTGESDIVAPANISIEVYDFHVGLESYVGAEQQDADTTDDSYKVTIAHDQQTVTLPVVLEYTNTGTEPITVTGFQQVNVSDGGAGFEYNLDEPVVVAPGETFTDEGELEFPVGEHVVDFKVLTAEGAFATDPIVVVVDQEEAPAPVPTPEPTPEVTPEATPETPVVEQEKPKTPTPVVPETGLEGKTVEAKTADELAGSTLVASAGQDEAGSAAGVLGALAAFALAAWGAITFRNRKAKDA